MHNGEGWEAGHNDCYRVQNIHCVVMATGLAVQSVDLAESVVGGILSCGPAGHLALHVEEHLRHELSNGHLISNVRHL